MSEIDIELLGETVEKMVECRLKELANLSDSHGVAFATSTMLSMCADIAGASLAMARDPEMQKQGAVAFVHALRASTKKYSADYATQELIDKVKA